MRYIAPSPELAEVDPRFHDLNLAQQLRVADVLLTVDRVPMRLAVDAVLATDKQENPRNAETK